MGSRFLRIGDPAMIVNPGQPGHGYIGRVMGFDHISLRIYLSPPPGPPGLKLEVGGVEVPYKLVRGFD